MKCLRTSASSFFGKFSGVEMGVGEGLHESLIKKKGWKKELDRFGISFNLALKGFICLSDF